MCLHLKCLCFIWDASSIYLRKWSFSDFCFCFTICSQCTWCDWTVLVTLYFLSLFVAWLLSPSAHLLQDGVQSLGPLPATPGFPRGSRPLPAGLFQKEKSSHRASDIYFILLVWAIVLVQVWLNLWILQLLPIPVAGNTHMQMYMNIHTLKKNPPWYMTLRPILHWYFSVGAEEAGGPLRPEELCWADSRVMVDGSWEVWTWTRGSPAAWTNQRPDSVPASQWH